MQLACDVLESSPWGLVAALREDIARRWIALPIAINCLCGLGWIAAPWRERPVLLSEHVIAETVLFFAHEVECCACDFGEPHLPELALHQEADTVVIETLDGAFLAGGPTDGRVSAAYIQPDANVAMLGLTMAADEIRQRMTPTTLIVLRFPGDYEPWRHPVKVRL